jgi:hypothetical protein
MGIWTILAGLRSRKFMGDNPLTSFLCMGDCQKLLFLNNSKLAELKDVLVFTQQIMEQNAIGAVSEMQLGTWCFSITSTELFFFLAGSENPLSIPYLTQQVTILKQVIYFLLGPNPDYTKLFLLLLTLT